MTFLVPAEFRGSRPGDAEAEAARLRMIAKRNREALAAFDRRGGSRSVR